MREYKLRSNAPFGAFSYLYGLPESHSLRPQHLQRVLMPIQGILSEAALPERLGRRIGKSKQQPPGWLTVQHRRAFLSPGHLSGESRFQCKGREARGALRHQIHAGLGRGSCCGCHCPDDTWAPSSSWPASSCRDHRKVPFCIFLLLKLGQPSPLPLLIPKVLAGAEKLQQKKKSSAYSGWQFLLLRLLSMNNSNCFVGLLWGWKELFN